MKHTILVLLMFCGLNMLGSPADEKVIISKNKDDLSITLTSDAGKFTGGNNSFCAVFRRRSNEELVPVSSLAVEFAQEVGKIREQSIQANMHEEASGRYCGQVNLGKQYYDPAFYYIFVHYAEGSGTKKKCRFFVTVK